MTAPVSALPPWQILAPLATTAVSRTWKVAAGGQVAVLRVDEPGARHLGLDRWAEPDVIRAAAAAGLAPDLLHTDTDRGLLLTAWLPGRAWSAADLQDGDNLVRAAVLLRRLHGTPLAAPVVDLNSAINRYAAKAGERCARLAATAREALTLSLARSAATDPAGPATRRCFCHNDPTPGNFIELPDGSVKLIDWEYAGLCQPEFDLAGLTAGAGLGPDRVSRFLTAYRGRSPTTAEADSHRAWEAACRALQALWLAALKNGLAAQSVA